ncbi:Hypothetical protein, putative [Bodo saltans]|uniref:Uncharacterized protein n=1 Tax=Bodo saltans TaxID=75058 RepID=A0A0S4JTU3_BODSA|nr:Hypothetical protein, putative [Bodo saltans]|eukprot:CUG93707.1 Hypothetical protein, putative [Bodo saltans]
MPNLDLESLQRILALEEDTLANPSVAHHLSTASQDVSSAIPTMESLRSPTTRTLMSIRQNQNAQGWISGQFAVAQQEQQGMSEVAEAAEELLKAPLVKSYASTVSTILRNTKEAVHGKHTALLSRNSDENDDAEKSGAIRSALELEDSSVRSAFPLVATNIQPCGRQAFIHADMSDADDPTTNASSTSAQHDADIKLVSGICFVLPKAETGTVIAQVDTPSALLMAARKAQTKKGDKEATHDRPHHQYNSFLARPPCCRAIVMKTMTQKKVVPFVMHLRMEDSSVRSAFPLVATNIQPCGRQAFIHADMSDADDLTTNASSISAQHDADIKLVSGICFVLPKAETGTVIAQVDTPSALLMAARKAQTKKGDDEATHHRPHHQYNSFLARGGDQEMAEDDVLRHIHRDMDTCFAGDVSTASFGRSAGGSAADSPAHQEHQHKQQQSGQNDFFSAADFGQQEGTELVPSRPQKSRMQQLLDEQKSMHKNMADSKAEYG